MPAIYLTDEEQEALYGSPALAQRLYILGIKRSMSYRTLIAGEETKISWQGLARELRVESAPGIKEELPSKPQVRRAAEHLVKRGLITILSDKMRLVIRCDLAVQPKFAQNKADTKPTPLAGTEANTDKKVQLTESKKEMANQEQIADTIANSPDSLKPTYTRLPEENLNNINTVQSDLDQLELVPETETIYQTAKGKTLMGTVLEQFEQFWDAFGYKNGKASAADAWLKIPWGKTPDEKSTLFEIILAGARAEAQRRPSVFARNGTPKMAQGWLTERRWEDMGIEIPSASKSITQQILDVGDTSWTEDSRERRRKLTANVMDVGDTDW